MAEYINRQDLDFLNDFCIDSGKYAGLRLDEVFDELATADVIERSEYEKLRLVNLDLAETNKGLLAEHEQLLKLDCKIDKAIEEIEGEYSTCNQDWIDGLNRALEILKRNIGE